MKSANMSLMGATWQVTPCVGVWIEIAGTVCRNVADNVTPCVGVWIEIEMASKKKKMEPVTPCVGVWIEISLSIPTGTTNLSLPAWECGLK